MTDPQKANGKDNVQDGKDSAQPVATKSFVDIFSDFFKSVCSTGHTTKEDEISVSTIEVEDEPEEEGPNPMEKTLISAAEEQLYSLTATDGVSGPTGRKKIVYPDGGCYEGPVLKGEWHGKGKLTFSNGAVYEGNFVHDIRHGKGSFIGANGECFEGDWVKGEPNGKGKLTYQNGESYEGDILAGGIFHGYGTYVWPESGKKYVGQWNHNKFHGNGKFWFDNGDTYDGEWRADLMHGKGIKVESGITYHVNYRDGFLTAYSRDGVLTHIVNEKVVLEQRAELDPVKALAAESKKPWDLPAPR